MSTQENINKYLAKKEARKNIYLGRVFAHSMGINEKKLYKEAIEKFEKEYPAYNEEVYY